MAGPEGKKPVTCEATEKQLTPKGEGRHRKATSLPRLPRHVLLVNWKGNIFRANMLEPTDAVKKDLENPAVGNAEPGATL